LASEGKSALSAILETHIGIEHPLSARHRAAHARFRAALFCVRRPHLPDTKKVEHAVTR